MDSKFTLTEIDIKENGETDKGGEKEYSIVMVK
jgi:hypothetical protein